MILCLLCCQDFDSDLAYRAHCSNVHTRIPHRDLKFKNIPPFNPDQDVLQRFAFYSWYYGSRKEDAKRQVTGPIWFFPETVEKRLMFYRWLLQERREHPDF